MRYFFHEHPLLEVFVTGFCIIFCMFCLGVHQEKQKNTAIQEAMENQAKIVQDGQEVLEDYVCFDWVDWARYNEEKNILYIHIR